MIKKLFSRIFSFRIRERGLLNPFIGLEISSLGEHKGVLEENNRETPIIISLASDRDHFSELPLTLYSLLNQNLKPDKIILWLDEDYEDFAYLPYEITQFIKNGLEIRFAKNIGNYTKTIYALKEYPNTIIVTADDGIFYPANWLYKLYISYIANPKDIQVHKAVQANTSIPFYKWKKSIKESSEHNNFMLDENGVLYPPNCFSKEVLRKDVFLKQAPDSATVWFWIMALVHDRKTRVVKNNLKTTIYTNFFKHFKYNLIHNKAKNSANDIAIQALLKLYGGKVYNKFK